MKKSNFLFLFATCLLSMTLNESDAQFAMNTQNFSSVEETMGPIKSGPESAVNTKAEKNFAKAYRQATGVEWSTLYDKSLMCYFYINNIPSRAFYTPKGQWLGTVSSYDGTKLDKSLREKIKTTFYDYNIVFVNQIDLVRSKTIYIIEIQDEKSIKKLRLHDDEMDVIREFAKP